ncbi:MAG: bifunctional methylenetetrahydrofolate dehydrogenase/methenyltetrahydrofolate cyclohydrolase FolD [Sandaracinaceae bacterium]|nr:bifunctional methylenetetrahydrofolate dehydrogenase/methenyltetrahydrofolate cyclohydrolase FolD [Sandaracinaceae bacterium]MDW8245454.1 bifunctional methylenetetrahydrofolate dehydrogenase/methenyltetrahydrofolate cyclohydrolase FolD [Sandaracinaceae bacterium]
MHTVILDGKALAKRIREEVACGVREFCSRAQRAPRLVVILVGSHPPSQIYVRKKEEAAREVGIEGKVLRLPEETSAASLISKIHELNTDPTVDGILVQLPLPKGVDGDAVIAAIDPQKDVDGLTPHNAGALWTGRKGLRPCTPLGCMALLEEAKIRLQGKRALVVGRSALVGKPMSAMLLERDATVTIAHSQSADLDKLVGEAEVLVAAAGRPRLIRGEWLRQGAVVIDVGINKTEGTLVGDVDFEGAIGRAAAITPVPGGVGPMTVAMLLRNVLEAAWGRLG